MHPLDNPVWHALTGPHEKVAEGVGGARRYDPDVAPFAALPDDAPPSCWDDLADLVGPDGTAVLFRGDVEPPDGWDAFFRVDALQMEAVGVEAAADPRAVELGPGDVPEMLDLVRRTEPGPFAPRTIELGTYLGLRVDGALVAMAGERVRPPGYAEISAVCTDPAHRGAGLAAALVRDLVGRIEARGERAFLHVVVDNTNAVRLYERLGFATRRTWAGLGLRRQP